jgi:hypothetical protein
MDNVSPPPFSPGQELPVLNGYKVVRGRRPVWNRQQEEKTLPRMELRLSDPYPKSLHRLGYTGSKYIGLLYHHRDHHHHHHHIDIMDYIKHVTKTLRTVNYEILMYASN